MTKHKLLDSQYVEFATGFGDFDGDRLESSVPTKQANRIQIDKLKHFAPKFK